MVRNGRWVCRIDGALGVTARSAATSLREEAARGSSATSGKAGSVPMTRATNSCGSPIMVAGLYNGRLLPGNERLLGVHRMCHLIAPTHQIPTPWPALSEPRTRICAKRDRGAGLIGYQRNAVPRPFSCRRS